MLCVEDGKPTSYRWPRKVLIAYLVSPPQTPYPSGRKPMSTKSTKSIRDIVIAALSVVVAMFVLGVATPTVATAAPVSTSTSNSVCHKAESAACKAAKKELKKAEAAYAKAKAAYERACKGHNRKKIDSTRRKMHKAEVRVIKIRIKVTVEVVTTPTVTPPATTPTVNVNVGVGGQTTVVENDTTVINNNTNNNTVIVTGPTGGPTTPPAPMPPLWAQFGQLNDLHIGWKSDHCVTVDFPEGHSGLVYWTAKFGAFLVPTKPAMDNSQVCSGYGTPDEVPPTGQDIVTVTATDLTTGLSIQKDTDPFAILPRIVIP